MTIDTYSVDMLLFLCVVASMVVLVKGAVRPPPPPLDHIETVLMEQYVLQMDNRQPVTPELREAMRDISRRRSSGSRTTEHYEMETELFRYMLKANSYLYMGSNLLNPLSYLDRECPDDKQSTSSSNNNKEDL
jgi:hypothetical protein